MANDSEDRPPMGRFEDLLQRIFAAGKKKVRPEEDAAEISVLLKLARPFKVLFGPAGFADACARTRDDGAQKFEVFEHAFARAR